MHERTFQRSGGWPLAAYYSDGLLAIWRNAANGIVTSASSLRS